MDLTFDTDEDEQHYLNERVNIPASLRMQFDGVTVLPRFRFIEQWSTQLGLRSDDPPIAVSEFLEVLLGRLAAEARDLEPRLDNRGVEIGDEVAKHFTIDERLAIAKYYGWLGQRVPKNLTFEMVDAATRQLIGDNIGVYVSQSLAYWRKRRWIPVRG